MNGYNCMNETSSLCSPSLTTELGSFFHYLCKNITISRDADGKTWIAEPIPGAPQVEQGDSSWIRSGYFLRWAVDSNSDPEVTLICFEGSGYIKERFEHIPPSLILSSVVLDPYSLFAIILDDLSLQMDNTVWKLLEVFRPIELVFQTSDRV
jgi:hypothetical protein